MIQTTRLGHIRGSAAGKNGAAIAVSMEVVNISKNPVAVPSQVLRSIQVNGKVYVIDRKGIIFGGSRQINTHELTGAAMGATSDWMNDVAKKQRAQAAAQKEAHSNVSVEVLGYGGR